MSQESVLDLSKFVEPDRVHKRVYTDQQIFDQEMTRIFERVWVYCGHESQIPNAGDYVAVTIGRQPMVMVRAADRRVHVVYNRCPHRGVQVVGNTHGNTGAAFVCSYHAWSFHLDGSVRAIPLAKGYEGTRMDRSNPDCNLKRAARVDSYRGFVFASLAAEGEPLLDFLGEAKVAFDDMCDRSPVGEVEVVPVCHRVVQHSNWKFFMENQLDALHPSVTHQSTGIAAGRVERRLKEQQGSAPLYYHYLSAFASSFEQWDSVQTINYPQGHGILKAYMGLRPQDKIELIAKLQAEGRKVLMIGDGLNDAPALATGHASISPANAADVAQTAADAVLQGEAMHPVLTILAVAKAARRRALENFAIAIGYNVVFVPLAVAGLVTPLIAAVAMSASSIAVTLNALRLARSGSEAVR